MDELTRQTFLAETRLHQQRVSVFLTQLAMELLKRAMTHDASKIEHPLEAELFAQHTASLKGLTYGSPEYQEALEKLKPALEHHYGANAHHPEFNLVNFFNQTGQEVDGMTLVDICEMLCDWVAATERHADGNVGKSLVHNKTRFHISDQLSQILLNTAALDTLWDRAKKKG